MNPYDPNMFGMPSIPLSAPMPPSPAEQQFLHLMGAMMQRLSVLRPEPRSILDEFDSQTGGGLELAPGAHGTLINASAKDQRAPRTVSVCCNVVMASDSGAQLGQRLELQLRWGTTKGSCVARLDLRHGTRVTVEAQHIEATAFYIDLAAEPGLGPTASIQLALAYAEPLAKVNTLTEDSFTLGALGVSAPMPIRAYARAVRVFSDRNPFTAANAAVVTFLRGANVVAIAAIEDIGTGVPNIIPIPGNAESWTVTAGAVAGVRYTPMSDLTL